MDKRTLRSCDERAGNMKHQAGGGGGRGGWRSEHSAWIHPWRPTGVCVCVCVRAVMALKNKH